MSNDGLFIENMDLSHIHYLYFNYKPNFLNRVNYIFTNLFQQFEILHQNNKPTDFKKLNLTLTQYVIHRNSTINGLYSTGRLANDNAYPSKKLYDKSAKMQNHRLEKLMHPSHRISIHLILNFGFLRFEQKTNCQNFFCLKMSIYY